MILIYNRHIMDLFFFIFFQNETELLEDSLALPEMPSFHQQSKFVSSEDEYLESDDFPLNNNNNNRIRFQPHGLIDTPRVIMPSGVGSMKRDIRRRPVPYSWLHKLVHLFFFHTKYIFYLY